MTASYTAKDDLLFALKWQMEMGIDCALCDAATGLYAAEAVRPPVPSAGVAPQSLPAFGHSASSAPTPTMLAEQVASPPIAEPVAVATQIANPLSGLQSLSDLRAALEAFEGCALKKTASNLVFADGNPAADIMLIGEAPGRDEDRMGLPFVGAAGQLLDRMLKSVGMDRQDVYITNILPWRPPGNRTPSAEETQLLWPFLRRHIQLKAPKVIFALGGSSAKLLLDSQTGILKLRGQMTKIDFSDTGDGSLMLPVLPSLHPAYLLRAPNMKKQAFSDLLQLCQYVKKAP